MGPETREERAVELFKELVRMYGPSYGDPRDHDLLNGVTVGWDGVKMLLNFVEDEMERERRG